MKKYLVKRIYQYSTYEWVMAESEAAAMDMPVVKEETPQNDDIWIDSQIIDEEIVDAQ